MWKQAFLLCTVLLLSWKLTASQDRDDEYYESDEFWEAPADNRECPGGQKLDESGKCVDCELGSYNFEEARVDECFPCPFGHFGNRTGLTACYNCDNWAEGRRGKFITREHGSTSADECIRPDLLKNFVEATVGFQVKVKGGDFCTDIDTFLWGVSKVIPFDGHFYQCEHSSDGSISSSTMSLELTLPTMFAWEFWGILDMVSTHRAVGNAYVKMARPYLEKISEFLENHSGMDQIGLSLDVDMIRDMLDNFEVIQFDPYFRAHCPVPGDNTQFCDLTGSDSVDPATVHRYYIKYTVPVSLADCNTNAGYTRVRNVIEHSKERNMDCLNRADEPCKMELVSCEGEEVIAAFINTFTKPENEISSTQFNSMTTSFSADNIQLSKSETHSGCGSDAVIDFPDNFELDCGPCKEGHFINDIGMCQKCPFGSWGEDGKQCNACGWKYETPFWGMDSEDYCVEKDNEWELTDDSDWEVERLRDLAGRIEFTLAITPEMNMCGVSNALDPLRRACQATFSEDDLVWKDELDMDELQIQRIVCMGVTVENVERGFTELCKEDWDMSWDDIYRSLEEEIENADNWVDLVCYVFKKVKDLDGEDVDTSDNCANLDESQYLMSMAASFDEEMDAGMSAVLVPILTRLSNLETMNFASFADAGKAMMESMGIEDMKAFTGWAVANELTDLGFEIPRGFRMAQFEFSPKYEREDFFCGDGSARRECDDGCNWDRCRKYDRDSEKDVQCRKDECDNCRVNWFWMQGEDEQPYECASCDFPDVIDSATLVKVNVDLVTAEYRCNEGFVSNSEDCGTWASCNYNSEPKQIERPMCVVDECDWPEVEHAEKFRDWRDEEGEHSCPFVQYRCEDGWMATEFWDRKIRCQPSEDFRIEGTVTCIERCTFSERIDHGKRVEDGRKENGWYFAIYECDENFYLRDRESAECDVEYNSEGQPVAVARLPRCGPPDSCEFPENIGEARKDDEWFDEERGTKGAQYECPEGMDIEGDSYLECRKDDPSQVDIPELKCYERKSCDYPDNISGGRKEEEYDHGARYECNDGYHMMGSDWAHCNTKTGTVDHMPRCEQEDTCPLPDWIERGYQAEKHHNMARYECHGGASLPDSIIEAGGWVSCEGENVTPEYPQCEEDSCHLPEWLHNGRREEKMRNRAKYYCNNEDGYKLPESIREEDGWVHCEGEETKPEYPSCQMFNCDFQDIENGVKENRDHTGMKSWYRCEEGFRFINEHNQARCNVDGEITYPRCIERGVRCDFSAVTIENGRVKEDDRDDFSIVVECNEDFRIRDGENKVYCGVDNEITFKPTCEPFRECTYQESIDNGRRTEDEREGGRRYECNEGFRFEGDDWAHCDTSTGTITHMPVCVEEEQHDDCHLPEYIHGGNQAEKTHNRARYECHGEWTLPESLRNTDGWAWCMGGETKPEYPRCMRKDGECHFPDVILGGVKVREDEHEGERYATYWCYPPLVMTPNKHAFMGLMKEHSMSPEEAYMTMAYTAGCYEGQVMLPECREPKEAGHCGIPSYIENGKAVELLRKEPDVDHSMEGTSMGSEEMDRDYQRLMPVMARYECEPGFKMHKTIKGDWGWCRKDGSYEVPRCEAEATFSELEFELRNGNEKKYRDQLGRVFAGVVMARDKTHEGEWEYGCNDGFNNHAAGAICRTIGYKHGAQISLTKKMQVVESNPVHFGWTNFGCKYDDTLPKSMNCEAQRYEEAMEERGMKAKCFDFDRMAIKCFNNTQFNMTASISYSKKKIYCRAMADKDGYKLDLQRGMGVEAKFLIDDVVIPDAEVQQYKYSMKKGYMIKIAMNMKQTNFRCLSCELHAGDVMMDKVEHCKPEY